MSETAQEKVAEILRLEADIKAAGKWTPEAEAAKQNLAALCAALTDEGQAKRQLGALAAQLDAAEARVREQQTAVDEATGRLLKAAAHRDDLRQQRVEAERLRDDATRRFLEITGAR